MLTTVAKVDNKLATELVYYNSHFNMGDLFTKANKRLYGPFTWINVGDFCYETVEVWSDGRSIGNAWKIPIVIGNGTWICNI